ncbi:cytosine permease [Bacillus sp. ISL-47]|uniref:purine-cytosine permease family protein n=1 Tax=Bacillus sp. ISL-47 TaxID=2819130 RepID=UPI001BECED19|nr:cytosine permease [Bacillus sp. ISL-47]MBT2689342.1 cytosine permease [Bacillus sp. ISL-47]MBT2706363.1 cytosine permease [Pseudomonas sp. ISL-84]
MPSSDKKHSTSFPSIEKFGLEAVPAELKTTKWFDYFYLQSAFSVNSGNFLVPALAVLTGGLSFLAAVASTVMGAAAAFLFVSLLSLPGSRHGIPAQFAIRTILGTVAARYISSPIRSLTSLYWFSVQAIGGSAVLISLLEKVFGIKLPLVFVSVFLAGLMSLLALSGFNTVKKAIKYFMPFLIIGQVVLFVLFIKELSSTQSFGSLTHSHWSFGSFFLYSSLAFIQYVSGVSASSDMARYASSAKGAFWGLFAGNTFGFTITAILGALSASLFGEWNPFVSASSLAASSWVLFLIFICAMTSMISINMNNAYTGGFSLLNIFQNLGRVKSTLIFGTAAVVLSCFPAVVNKAQAYISILGIFIIPISAVIIADFLFVKKGTLSEAHLTKLFISQSDQNREGLIAIIFGALIYLALPDLISPGFISFFLTGIGYIIFHKYVRLNGNRQLKRQQKLSS